MYNCSKPKCYSFPEERRRDFHNDWKPFADQAGLSSLTRKALSNFSRRVKEVTKGEEILCRTRVINIIFRNNSVIVFQKGKEENYILSWNPVPKKRYHHQFLKTAKSWIFKWEMDEKKTSKVENLSQTRDSSSNQSGEQCHCFPERQKSNREDKKGHEKLCQTIGTIIHSSKQQRRFFHEEQKRKSQTELKSHFKQQHRWLELTWSLIFRKAEK